MTQLGKIVNGRREHHGERAVGTVGRNCRGSSRSLAWACSSLVRTLASGTTQFREVFFPKFAGTSRAVHRTIAFGTAQVDAPDLSGNRLRQVGKFETPDALERRDSSAHVF
jgi:hypothetical protein